MRMYWGRAEPRITGLTLKIMGVNAAALVMLLIGVLYLGQYQNTLITAKLETFGAETQLIATALSESAVETPDIPAWKRSGEETEILPALSEVKAKQMIYSFGRTTKRQIYLFRPDGTLLADSHKLAGPGSPVEIADLPAPQRPLRSVETLKSMTGFILKLLPDYSKLPLYIEKNNPAASDFIDAASALNGRASLSAWENQEEKIFLTAATPLEKNGKIVGAVMLTRPGKDIENEINDVWMNVIQIFIITLILTIMLSIYLSGVIARPLRRLARAAESVRTGQSKAAEIPDLSDRHDEIGELSIALRSMTDALWNQMDSIESFAADVSHELKNPLTSLRSAIETLSIVKTEKDKNKLMDIIRHDLERIDRLIGDISKASRLDSELSREKLQRINLAALLNRLLDIYRNPLNRHEEKSNTVTTGGITILVQPPPQDVFVPGIENRLLQVLENLISNALSFSPENGKITIAVSPQDRAVQIMVEDEGPGIPENNLEDIFLRFYSQRPDTEDYGQHSGLGLSICKQIITALGGHIYAENRKGKTGQPIKGARFVIILPRL